MTDQVHQFTQIIHLHKTFQMKRLCLVASVVYKEWIQKSRIIKNIEADNPQLKTSYSIFEDFWGLDKIGSFFWKFHDGRSSEKNHHYLKLSKIFLSITSYPIVSSWWRTEQWDAWWKRNSLNSYLCSWSSSE